MGDWRAQSTWVEPGSESAAPTAPKTAADRTLPAKVVPALPNEAKAPAPSTPETQHVARSTQTALSFGIRSGWSIPFGTVYQNSKLGDLVTGAAPIRLDVGYRRGHFFLGVYWETGFDIINYNPTVPRSGCVDSSTDCTMRSLRVGLDWLYSLAPDQRLDPWIGTWFGSERQTLDISSAQGRGSWEFNSMEYLGIQLGVDYHPSLQSSIGPYLSYSFSRYDEIFVQRDNTNVLGIVDTTHTATHAWLSLGLRATYEIVL